MTDVDAVISSLHIGPEKFQLIDQGSIDKYLGLMITDIDSGFFKMSQPFLVCRILEFLSLDENRPKGAILWLENLCLIVILIGYLVSTLGYIVAQSACSVISETVFDLRFKWRCIKQLDSW
jgi:hypothetical protein